VTTLLNRIGNLGLLLIASALLLGGLAGAQSRRGCLDRGCPGRRASPAGESQGPPIARLAELHNLPGSRS